MGKSIKKITFFCTFILYIFRLLGQSSIDSLKLIPQNFIEDTIYTCQWNVDLYPRYIIKDKSLSQRYLYDSISRLYKVVKIERLTDFYLISIEAMMDKQPYSYTIISFLEENDTISRNKIREGGLYLLTLYKTDDYNRNRDRYHAIIDMVVENKRVLITNDYVLKYKLVTSPDIKGLSILNKNKIIKE